MTPLSTTLPKIEAIARAAGAIALNHFNALAELPVERKGHLDLVTEADREVERFLVSELKSAFPDDGIFGEEGGAVSGRSGRIWVIDPIDGTFNFVRGGQDWAISIGLFQNDVPKLGVIYAPVRDLMLVGGDGVPASKNGKPVLARPEFNPKQISVGIGMHPSILTADRLEVVRYITDDLGGTFRCCGSTTLSLIAVALGETDGYVALGDSTWDVMAGLPILSALGAASTIDWGKTDLQDKLRFACGSEAFLQKVMPLIERIDIRTTPAGVANA